MKKTVTVVRENQTEEVQPSGFRCCPLGVQFYSDEEVQSYKIMELDLKFPSNGCDPLDARCRGVVVQSAFDKAKSKYRTWLMFTDLVPEARDRLKCISKDCGVQCPHCENY